MALTLIFVLAILGADSGRCAAPEKTIRKLASLAPLPQLSASMALGSEQIAWPDLIFSTNEMVSRAERLRKELDGTPADGERHYEIARLLKLAQRGPAAVVAFSNAASIYRPRAEARPADGALQARFADMLGEIGQAEEAEHLMRAALKRIPNDWHGHAELGALLGGRALRLVLGTNAATRARGTATMAGVPDVAFKPRAADVEEALRSHAEAVQCFNRAVELAPKEPGAWLARALHRIFAGMFQQAIDRARDQPRARPLNTFDFMSSDAICADWEQVARLSPTNHAAIGYWGWSEALPALMQAGDDKPIDSLTGRRRRHLLESMRMLEQLTDRAPARSSAAAWETIGMLRAAVFQDAPGAVAAFRRATEIDPARRNAWECLAGLTASEDRPSELITVCEGQLKHHDTARSRIMLAKAFDKAGQREKALAQARLAVQKEPGDLAAQLSAAALHLRRAAEPGYGHPWNDHLYAASRLVDELPEVERGSALVVNWLVLGAVAFGVDGDPAAARRALRKAMTFDAADHDCRERMKEIETALGR